MEIVYAALAALPLLVLPARLLTGWERDATQLVALLIAAGAAWQETHDPLRSFAAAGLGLALYAVYEWVTASSDAAKTTVISRHTGRRLPPI